MTAKLDLFASAPAAMKQWYGASMAISGSLDQTLVHLVEIRASQINGCGNCVNLHTTFAREAAYQALKANFTDEEQVKLTLMINVINGWNRLGVGFSTWTDPAVVRAQMGKVAAA